MFWPHWDDNIYIRFTDLTYFISYRPRTNVFHHVFKRLWPLTSGDLDLNFYSHTSGIGGLLDMELKMIWIDTMLDPLYQLELWPSDDNDFGISRSNVKMTISQERVDWLAWHGRDINRCNVGPTIWIWTLSHPWPRPWFSRTNCDVAVFHESMSTDLFENFQIWMRKWL